MDWQTPLRNVLGEIFLYTFEVHGFPNGSRAADFMRRTRRFSHRLAQCISGAGLFQDWDDDAPMSMIMDADLFIEWKVEIRDRINEALNSLDVHNDVDPNFIMWLHGQLRDIGYSVVEATSNQFFNVVEM